MTAKNNQFYLNYITEAFNLYWRTIGKARDMEHHTGDIEYVKPKGGIGPERVFNINLSPESVEQRLDELVNDIKAGDIPNNFFIGPNTKPVNLAEILVQKGFSIDREGLCMVMELCDLKSFSYNTEEIQVGFVEGLDKLKNWVDIINVALYGHEIMSLAQFSDIYHLDSTKFFLALYNGAPAAVTMTIVENDVATLEFVATLNEYRNKGLGTAVVTCALEYVKEKGMKFISLRAEPDAINLYKKLGFKGYCDRIIASLN